MPSKSMQIHDLADCLESAEGHEGSRYADRTVGALIVLQDGDQRATDGESRAVEGVNERRLRFRVAAVANSAPSGLEIGAIRTRADLAVELLSREPHFEIIRLGSVESDIARAEREDAIRKLELFEQGGGVGRQSFERLERSLGLGEPNRFDLLRIDVGE